MFLLYNFIFFIYGLFYFPYALICGKKMNGFCFRSGCFPQDIVEKIQGKENIWVHAVSVGEVLAVLDLLKKLKGKYPTKQIVLSTVTATGHEVAQANFSKEGVVIFAPFDFSWVVSKFARVIAPQIYIAAETELWPNLYTCLQKHATPIVQVNGRISDRSFRRYSKIKFLTRRVLPCITRLCMQSEEDAKRISFLGAEKTKVLVTGNLKFDNLPPATIFSPSDLGFDPNGKILVAGSTHSGEEVILLNVYRQLKMSFPELRLVICPRHVERAQEVFKIIESHQFPVVLYSELGKNADGRVVVVDVIGKLRELYSVATLVYVGKTLTVGGGQNMIEPAFYGKATFVGPLTYNFKDVMRIFLNDKAMIQVQNEEQLLAKMKTLLADAKLRDTIGKKAQRLVQKYQGATAKTLQTIAEIL